MALFNKVKEETLSTDEPSEYQLEARPEKERTTEPLKTGFLTKEGAIRKSWKKRFFVLTEGGCLYYYKDDGSNPPQGVILLERSVVGDYPDKAHTFTVNTPMQHALAIYLQDPTPYLQLPAFYQAKRDLFRQGLEGSRLRLLPSTGSYFQCVDISAVSDLSEADFCQWLTREIGVAAIPLSAFYGDGFDQRVVRFCFAKKDETLREAIARLRKL